MSATPEGNGWQRRKKNMQKNSKGANRQQPVWMIASLERAASPFFTSAIHCFHVAYCVFYVCTVCLYIYLMHFYLSNNPPSFDIPNWYSSNSNLPLCFIHSSDSLVVNKYTGGFLRCLTQVFNLGVNVFCLVSFLFTMM